MSDPDPAQKEPAQKPVEELRASNANQHGDDGVRDASSRPSSADDDTPPEQSPGNVEENPTGIPPKAGYPSKDPRSKD